MNVFIIISALHLVIFFKWNISLKYPLNRFMTK